MLKQSPKRTLIARNLRKRESWSERLIWSWLRAHRFANYKFRRQHIVVEHVLDFYCHEAKLNIEVDGFQHSSPEQRAKDCERDAFLNSKGIRVLRFGNSRLRRDREVIRETIWCALQERAPHPLPDYLRPGVSEIQTG